jgi:hypothetical protein
LLITKAKIIIFFNPDGIVIACDVSEDFTDLAKYVLKHIPIGIKMNSKKHITSMAD